MALISVTIGLNVVWMLSLWLVDRPDSGYVTVWDGWIYHVATTLPAVLALVRAREDRRHRRAWVLVALGIVLNTAGNLIFTYHDQNLDPIPFPAWSDVPYLASYVTFALALLSLTHRSLGAGARAAHLDGLIVGMATGAAAVASWFETILEQSGGHAAVLVGFAYPLMDVVLIVVAMSGLSVSRFRPPPAVLAFTFAAAVLALGDVVYLHQVAAESYVPGTALEVTWVVGMVLFGVAPWLRPETRRPDETTVAAAVVPGVAAVGALTILGWGILRPLPALAMWLAVGAIAAVLARVGWTVRELRRANEAFRQARTDDLTGLLNRRGFAETLDDRLRRGDRHVVMLIDLNGFKEVNDSLGHHAGDQLLTVVGRRFARVVPDSGLLARLGGDEFGVAVFDTDSDEIARKLLACLDEPIALDDITVRVGASLGIAVFPDHGTTRAELLRAADVAMYDAKTNHLGVAYYRAEHDPHSKDRLALLEELRQAIEHRSFDVHYQPIINVMTGTVVGMESLIRWNHPRRGMLAPHEFVPLAERVGLIPALTRAVLDISVAHLAQVRRSGHMLRLSVNISAKDLVDDRLPAYIRATLAAHQVAPELLTLEITETAITSDTVRAERVINELRADGVRIAIDDFGVGYSSMSQLLELPLDELKLDRSFIANLDRDVRAQAILAATVELGRTLGLDVVAEGVEHHGALEEVAGRGVGAAQGFLFSPALAPADFLRFVDATRVVS